MSSDGEMKILLAEDDRVARLMMERALKSFGYEVVLAEDGREAAEILSRRDGPRLALVDWMMPNLDGPGLCREVRSRHTDGSYVYILLLTSKQGSEDIVAGLEAGADDYITKPCGFGELKARLHTGRRILILEEKLVQAREEMRVKATRDGLTSLWNRNSILGAMTAELERSSRTGRPMSVVLCDIDHFKRINDNFGHLVGDLALREVAARLNRSVRVYDAVGRYGGEEFLIVLSDCSSSDLRARAEELRSAVCAPGIAAQGREVSLSISIGAVACEPCESMYSMDKILARADLALYQAKHEGRNRSVIAEPFAASRRAVFASGAPRVGIADLAREHEASPVGS